MKGEDDRVSPVSTTVRASVLDAMKKWARVSIFFCAKPSMLMCERRNVESSGRVTGTVKVRSCVGSAQSERK